MGFENLGSALLSTVNQMGGIGDSGPSTFSFDDLGDFAQKVDRSAQRQYIEDGLIRNSKPRNLEILMQEPDITVLIKKKQFSSLAENYRFDLMNEEEKLYINSIKKLFQNKCQLIANYERLTKIEKIAQAGPVSDYILPLLFGSVDAVNQLKPGLIDAKTQSVIEALRKVKNFSDPTQFTTWLTDGTVPGSSPSSNGTGVIELTNVASLNVTNSVKFLGGSANLMLEDPYKLMTISTEDIEQAISQVSNFASNPFIQETANQLESSTSFLKEELAKSRTIRGAGQIIFSVNENSLLTKKVRAFIDLEGRELIFSFAGGFLGLGASVDLDQSAREGLNGLNELEESLFVQIIQNIYVALGLQSTSQAQVKYFNQQTNYVRQKMYAEFNGHSIIQPMDVIHIFISSKTKLDSKVSAGFSQGQGFGANSLLTKLNTSLGQVASGINDLNAVFGSSAPGQSAIETERDAIVGPEFPLWLWYLMRNDFTRQGAGTHVFAGLVESVPQSYNGGKYTIQVSAKDNTSYFTFGQVNRKPAVDTFDSALYDPLTPFKLDFDAASGFQKGETPDLLDENISLLNSGSLKWKAGRFRGSKVDQDSYKILDGEGSESIASNLFQRKFNDPDGFVYRWKKGIGSLVLFGEPHSAGFRNQASPAITNDPFAGQDVMNVLSLLVTGQPYNFNNFLKAALSTAALNNNDLYNLSGSSSYFRGLLNDLSKNNATWGNFIPFKKLIINEAGYQFLRQGQTDLSVANRTATDLLRQRATRFDELTSIMPAFANNPQFYQQGLDNISLDGNDLGSAGLTVEISKLIEDIFKLDNEINSQTEAFQKSLKNPNLRGKEGTLKIIGDDISFDSSFTQDSSLTPQAKALAKEEFRKKIAVLTQRRLWKVKANEDQNLFIVDDAYDKNYDIQAFEQSLVSGLQTFKSTYSKVSEQIESVSQLLGLEVFADSQGHIQARAPQYNRIPSSVLLELVNTKAQTGVQIFPTFLERLFFNQIQGLTDRIEIIEDEIRLRAAALGYIDDQEVKQLLRGGLDGLGAVNGEAQFSFVTSSTGTLGSQDLRQLLFQTNPDLAQESTRKALSELNSLVNGPANTGINFDLIQRANVLNQQAFNNDQTRIESRINELRDRLEVKTGQAPLTKKQLLPNDRTLTGAGRSQLDLLELSQQISQFLTERQQAIKILANAIKNLDQGVALNQDPKIANNVLFPFLNQKADKLFPEILEHMIEDDYQDDLGDGSAGRYRLREVEIIDYRIDPSPPPMTMVEVDGSLAGGLVSGPSGLEIGQGGNGISAAMSVDYDMWRQYGWRGYQAVQVPFLSDPQSQCAPYGVFLLNQARKNILKGSVTRVGNEFTQAGEVYYLEDRNLLFYAESVTHSFAYGQQFTTSLSLTYGHTPGEFIPTMLDVIGKGLYAGQYPANLVRHARNINADGNTPLISLLRDSYAPVPEGAADKITSLITGAYGENNRKQLNNLILNVTDLLTPTQLGEQLKLEIRVYFNTEKGFDSDDNLKSVAEGVKDWLTNPSIKVEGLSGPSLLPDNSTQSSIPKDKVEVVLIDLGLPEETRSPSAQAWSLAKGLTFSKSFSSPNQTLNDSDSQLAAMFTQVVDCWGVFQPPVTTVGESADQDPENDPNQDQLERQAAFLEAFQAKIKTLQNQPKDV